MRTAKITLGQNINSEVLREGFAPGETVTVDIDEHGAAWINSRITYLEANRKCVVYSDDYTEVTPQLATPKGPAKLPSKGEYLDRIFAHSDRLQLFDKQIALLKENGLELVDLYQLQKRNPAAYRKWNKYHRRSNRITAFLTHTVNGKL